MTLSRAALAALATLVLTAGPVACPELDPDGPDAPPDAGDAATPDATAPDTGPPTWGAIHDPLSRPATPTLSPDDFTPAATCGICHTQHYAEWRRSNHAYAVIDPVFRALVAVRQADFGGAQDAYCMQCHTAIGTRGGEVVPGFAFDDLSPIVQEGITCEACHRVSAVERLYNAGHVIDPQGPIRGPIANPIATSGHKSEGSPIFARSEFCAACHEVIELSGLPLERPYAEWLASPSAAAGQSCQGCHMPTYRGRATTAAPERDLHRHHWVGVDVPLAPGFVTPAVRAEIAAEVAALLAQAATLTLAGPTTVPPGGQLDLVATVRNDVPGHNLPTGSTFLRQLWLEVIATAADGRVLYATGTLDDNGDLRDRWSALSPYGDPDLVSFSSSFVDAHGVPELFPWRAAEHTSTTLPPGHHRSATLFVPVPVDARFPLTVTARLRFRAVAPYLLRALDLGALAPEVPIFDLDAASLIVPGDNAAPD